MEHREAPVRHNNSAGDSLTRNVKQSRLIGSFRRTYQDTSQICKMHQCMHLNFIFLVAIFLPGLLCFISYCGVSLHMPVRILMLILFAM